MIPAVTHAPVQSLNSLASGEQLKSRLVLICAEQVSVLLQVLASRSTVPFFSLLLKNERLHINNVMQQGEGKGQLKKQMLSYNERDSTPCICLCTEQEHNR